MLPSKDIDELIIETYFGSTRGIKGTAGVLGLSKTYVGKIISKYKKKHGLRWKDMIFNEIENQAIENFSTHLKN